MSKPIKKWDHAALQESAQQLAKSTFSQLVAIQNGRNVGQIFAIHGGCAEYGMSAKEEYVLRTGPRHSDYDDVEMSLMFQTAQVGKTEYGLFFNEDGSLYTTNLNAIKKWEATYGCDFWECYYWDEFVASIQR